MSDELELQKIEQKIKRLQELQEKQQQKEQIKLSKFNYLDNYLLENKLEYHLIRTIIGDYVMKIYDETGMIEYGDYGKSLEEVAAKMICKLNIGI